MTATEQSYGEPNINRLLAAIRHQPGDRVPNFEARLKARNIAAALGRPIGEDSTELPAEDHLALIQRIHQDAVHTDVRWELGFVCKETGDGSTSYVDGAIKDSSHLDAVQPPALDHFEDRLLSLKTVTRGTGAGVSCAIGGPLSTAYLAAGLTDFCLSLYDDMPFVERLLDVTTRFCQRAMDVALRVPVDLVWILDDLAFCSGPIMRPDMLRDLWFHRIRELIEPAHQAGIPVVLHSDGNLSTLVPMVVEAGFKGLHPIEPCGGDFDIYHVKAVFGRELCLFGNIDVAGVLSAGDPDEVRADVREHIDRLADGGGYVVSSSHSIQDSVPPENFRAMLDAVLSHGAY